MRVVRAERRLRDLQRAFRHELRLGVALLHTTAERQRGGPPSVDSEAQT